MLYHSLLILLLFTIGTVILLVEVLVIPGSTIVGLVGFGVQIYGYYLGYEFFGDTIGHIILAIGLIISAIIIRYSFKPGMWDKLTLKDKLQGKIFDEEFSKIKVGDIGKTISALRPSGKAEFNEENFEVHSPTTYIGAGEKIQVTHITNNKIIVELFKTN
jgi:membrane-bound ClpP family serine protease